MKKKQTKGSAADRRVNRRAMFLRSLIARCGGRWGTPYANGARQQMRAARAAGVGISRSDAMHLAAKAAHDNEMRRPRGMAK